jgi:hypothetical protein
MIERRRFRVLKNSNRLTRNDICVMAFVCIENLIHVDEVQELPNLAGHIVLDD